MNVSGTLQQPPAHVLSGFGVKDATGEHLPGSTAWRYGGVLLRPVTNPSQAAWVAATLDGLQVNGVRVGRPVRSTDGRWVLGGWAAMRYLQGEPEARHDEVVAVSVRLHQATVDCVRPRFLGTRTDAFARADRMAWGEEEADIAPSLGGRLFDLMSCRRKEIELADQLVHADLFGNVLFHSAHPPAIVDFVPYWRPAEWAAAVVVVDALAWGGADASLIERWSHLPEWPQMLLRALLFRLAGHALHPHSTPESLRGIEAAARRVTDVV